MPGNPGEDPAHGSNSVVPSSVALLENPSLISSDAPRGTQGLSGRRPLSGRTTDFNFARGMTNLSVHSSTPPTPFEAPGECSDEPTCGTLRGEGVHPLSVPPSFIHDSRTSIVPPRGTQEETGVRPLIVSTLSVMSPI
jgi:hypothetical protein